MRIIDYLCVLPRGCGRSPPSFRVETPLASINTYRVECIYTLRIHITCIHYSIIWRRLPLHYANSSFTCFIIMFELIVFSSDCKQIFCAKISWTCLLLFSPGISSCESIICRSGAPLPLLPHAEDVCPLLGRIFSITRADRWGRDPFSRAVWFPTAQYHYSRHY